MKINHKNTINRRDEIVRLITKYRKVRVDELSERFQVSEVTIRNDLSFLEKKGILHRSYGGALIKDSVALDESIFEKVKMHAEEKDRIGKAAAELIFDGDAIILDSGTTTSAIVKYIKNRKNLTILTNAVNIASELAGLSDIEVLLTGGILRKKSFSLVGPQAEQILRSYYFDKVFLGVDGFDLSFGLTTPNYLEAQLNKLMVEMSKQVIAVADSSKFNRQSLCLITKPTTIDKVITDNNISDDQLKGLKELGIETILV
ncbi:transcriptional repressor AgaR [Candidatus Neomarinimicrobiota bacterium]